MFSVNLHKSVSLLGLYFESMIFFIVFSLIIALAVVACFYLAICVKYRYFSKNGVLGPKPTFPYGNTKDGYQGKRNMVYDIDEIYR